ncbi:hypothetical protein D3C80_799390 [compost metagenome]
MRRGKHAIGFHFHTEQLAVLRLDVGSDRRVFQHRCAGGQRAEVHGKWSEDIDGPVAAYTIQSGIVIAQFFKLGADKGV